MIRMLNPKNILTWALCLSALAGLGSCIDDRSECPDPDDGNETVSPAEVCLKLRLTANMGGTRADHDSETEDAGVPAESYINLDDLQLLLFDADREFLQNLRPQGIPVRKEDGSVDMVLHIQDKYFMDNIGSGGIRFYIMALANSRSMGAPWLAAWRKGGPGPDGKPLEHGTTIEELCRRLQSTTMTVKPETYKLLEAGKTDVTYTPQYMPMSGIQVYRVSDAELKSSGEDNPFELADPLSLLRALAKIEVVDKINYTGNFTPALENLPERIQKIELAGYVNSGNLLPLYSQWQGTGTGYPVYTQQLTSPCIPEHALFMNPPAFDRDYNKIEGWNGNMLLDFERSGSRAIDNAPVYSCYVYEFLNPAPGTTVNVTQPPYLNITVKGSGDGSASKIYTMRLASYTDGETTDADYLTELVRNHIYRYEITALENFKANLTLTVMDWEAKTIEWQYTENVGVDQAGAIRWTYGTYLSMNQDDAYVILKDDLSAAQCYFTISQPINAEWRAMFVPIGDTPADAFLFQTADGKVSSTSGTIDGNRITLNIVPKDVNISGQQYQARLQIIVTLPSGTSMNADVCAGRYGENKYFTVRQNFQLN